jgi:hypothetical protein
MTRSLSNTCESLIDKFNKFIMDISKVISSLFITNILKYTKVVLCKGFVVSGFVISSISMTLAIGKILSYCSIVVGIVYTGISVYEKIYSLFQMLVHN